MQNQNYVTQQAFGYGSPSLPQYIRAMVAKLNGGTYADCVRAYYDSTTQVYQKQLATGLIDEKTFRKECRTRLRVAVASTRRLFYGDYNSTDDSRHLVRSRDTAYLEQLELATELKKAGMEKFLYVLGANFSSLEFLLRARFLDPNDIRLPDFYSLELWGQVRDAYVLGDED